MPNPLKKVRHTKGFVRANFSFLVLHSESNEVSDMVDARNYRLIPTPCATRSLERPFVAFLLTLLLPITLWAPSVIAQTSTASALTTDIAPAPADLEDTDYFAVFNAATNAARRTALGTARVNVNGPYDPNRLNVYLLKPSAIDGVRGQPCNCRTLAGKNVVYCDQALIKATINSFDFSGAQTAPSATADPEVAEVMVRTQDDNAASILTWIIGHEVGHIAFDEQRIGPSAMPDGGLWTRRGEEEWADRFALDGVSGAERSASALFFSELAGRL
ncbi:hypothetical protein, partial [Sphingomonas bacterium]|uniref:hypothetical protein n=1 Tax=Sphingomonas bacterium TaxID=1895847 RepID=UPI00157699F6